MGPSPRDLGFEFSIPDQVARNSTVRVYAVADGTASRLPYLCSGERHVFAC
jgi:hypothetical protein